MLVACRLAGLSALETCLAGVSVGAQFGRREPRRAASANPETAPGHAPRPERATMDRAVQQACLPWVAPYGGAGYRLTCRQ